jgi:hypothetical protein
MELCECGKKLPLCERGELDLQVFNQTEGDNGQVKRIVDTNGKLSLHEDVNTLKRREISRLDCSVSEPGKQRL